MAFFNENSVVATTSAFPWTHIAGGVAAATTLFFLLRKVGVSPTHKNNLPFPPGPPAVWFWQDPMPNQKAVPRLTELVDQYGPVISFRRGRDVTIVIGRMDAATEIMEKEGASLADRPQSIAANEILSGGMRLVLAPAGDRFRRLRRAVHSHLQPKAAKTYEEIQAETARGVILDILNNPKHHLQHATRYASAVILRVTYGKSTPTSYNDPELVRVRQVLFNFQRVYSQSHLVDRIPLLRYVPGYCLRLRELHQRELELFRDQLERVKKEIARNSAGPSFAKTLLEHIDDHHFTNDEMAYLGGTFFAAGSDTTATGISVMVMAAACHTDAQARVQQELDEVVGRDRVPTFDDWDMLPQLQAFVLEALRWRPVSPMGFAHRSTKDIIWRGHCIPAGATVLGFHWGISRDPVAFPDPEMFNPQRWLTEGGSIRPDMHFYTYGFGRRVCPGQHVANRSLYMNLALLLWSFRILQRPEAPIDTTLSDELQDAIIFHPKPFHADFIPRMEEGILREMMTAKREA